MRCAQRLMAMYGWYIGRRSFEIEKWLNSSVKFEIAK